MLDTSLLKGASISSSPLEKDWRNNNVKVKTQVSESFTDQDDLKESIHNKAYIIKL